MAAYPASVYDVELGRLLARHGSAWDITRERGRLVAVSRDDARVRFDAGSAGVLESLLSDAEFPSPGATGAPR